jgi:hypothetical protein
MEDFAFSPKTCALNRAILDGGRWHRHGQKYVAVFTDGAAGLTGSSSSQVCFLLGRQRFPPHSLCWSQICLIGWCVQSLSRRPIESTCGWAPSHWKGVLVFALGRGSPRQRLEHKLVLAHGRACALAHITCGGSALGTLLPSVDSSCSDIPAVYFPPATLFRSVTYCPRPASSLAQASNASGFAVAALSAAPMSLTQAVSLVRTGMAFAVACTPPWPLHLNVCVRLPRLCGIFQSRPQAQDRRGLPRFLGKSPATDTTHPASPGSSITGSGSFKISISGPLMACRLGATPSLGRLSCMRASSGTRAYSTLYGRSRNTDGAQP